MVSKSNSRLGTRLSQKLDRKKEQRPSKMVWIILGERKAACARIGVNTSRRRRNEERFIKTSNALQSSDPPGRTGGIINRQAKQERGRAYTQTRGRAVTAQKPVRRIRRVTALAAKPGVLAGFVCQLDISWSYHREKSFSWGSASMRSSCGAFSHLAINRGGPFVGGTISGLVVLGSIREQAEQANM